MATILRKLTGRREPTRGATRQFSAQRPPRPSVRVLRL